MLLSKFGVITLIIILTIIIVFTYTVLREFRQVKSKPKIDEIKPEKKSKVHVLGGKK